MDDRFNREFVAFLVNRGIGELRAYIACGLIEPLFDGYFDSLVKCPFVSRWTRKPRKSRKKTVAEEPIEQEASPSEVMNVPPDGLVQQAIAAFGMPQPRRILLAGDDCPGYIRRYDCDVILKFVYPAGLYRYTSFSHPNPLGNWLVEFVEMMTGKASCEKCSHRWLDREASHYLHFLATGDADCIKLAECYEPWLRLAPFVKPIGYSDDNDLYFAVR